MVSGIGIPVRTAMRERFGDSIEKESHCHTGRVEHEEVTGIVKFGLFVLFTELDVSVAVGEPKDKKGKGRVGNNVEPSELFCSRGRN